MVLEIYGPIFALTSIVPALEEYFSRPILISSANDSLIVRFGLRVKREGIVRGFSGSFDISLYQTTLDFCSHLGEIIGEHKRPRRKYFSCPLTLKLN